MSLPTPHRATDDAIMGMIAEIRREQTSFKAEQAEIKAEQAEIKAELVKNSELTAGIFELFNAAKGTFKVFGWIGKGITWVGGVAAALGALWFVAKGGFPPK